MSAATNTPMVIHVSPRVQGRGGIETLQEIHRHWPGPQLFVALFDRELEARPGYINLNFSWGMSLSRMRRKFEEALAPYRGGIVIYHNGWGLPLFHDLDGALRRLVFFHTSPDFAEMPVSALNGLVDGAIGVTPAWSGAWGILPAERTAVVHAPVVPPPISRSVVRPATKSVVLGFAGRIEREHKRLDRLPGLIRELRARGFDFRFEIAGDGTLRRELENELKGCAHFHGWASHEKLWQIMSGWDAMVFFSDREGGPIALFEGMSLGLIPFYPTSGGSWGDVHTPRVDPRCYYPHGDMAAMAAAIQEIFSRDAAQIDTLRARSIDEMSSWGRSQYDDACLGLIRRIAALPRISKTNVRGAKLTDLLPLGIATRFARWALRRA